MGRKINKILFYFYFKSFGSFEGFKGLFLLNKDTLYKSYNTFLRTKGSSLNYITKADDQVFVTQNLY